MIRKSFAFTTAAAALCLTPAAFAQAPTTNPATMSATDVGVSPLTGTSATDYVKLAADSDKYEIMSSKIALMKSKRQDVRGFAKMMIVDHTGSTKSLMAALSNQDRKITPPSMMLSSDNQAKIDLLRKAPKASFDQLYLQQQMQGHQNAWALHDGYATDGTDPTLKQVATTIVPAVERHLAMLKTMNAGM